MMWVGQRVLAQTGWRWVHSAGLRGPGVFPHLRSSRRSSASLRDASREAGGPALRTPANAHSMHSASRYHCAPVFILPLGFTIPSTCLIDNAESMTTVSWCREPPARQKMLGISLSYQPKVRRASTRCAPTTRPRSRFQDNLGCGLERVSAPISSSSPRQLLLSWAEWCRVPIWRTKCYPSRPWRAPLTHVCTGSGRRRVGACQHYAAASGEWA
jgi:hypothetical protein